MEKEKGEWGEERGRREDEGKGLLSSATRLLPPLTHSSPLHPSPTFTSSLEFYAFMGEGMDGKEKERDGGV